MSTCGEHYSILYIPFSTVYRSSLIIPFIIQNTLRISFVDLGGVFSAFWPGCSRANTVERGVIVGKMQMDGRRNGYGKPLV